MVHTIALRITLALYLTGTQSALHSHSLMPSLSSDSDMIRFEIKTEISKKYEKDPETVYAYGTAGFRMK